MVLVHSMIRNRGQICGPEDIQVAEQYHTPYPRNIYCRCVLENEGVYECRVSLLFNEFSLALVLLYGIHKYNEIKIKLHFY